MIDAKCCDKGTRIKMLSKNVHAAGLVESYMRVLGIDSRLVPILHINSLHNLSWKYSFKCRLWRTQDLHPKLFLQCYWVRLWTIFFLSSQFFLGYLVKLDVANIVAEFNNVFHCLLHLTESERLASVLIIVKVWLTAHWNSYSISFSKFHGNEYFHRPRQEITVDTGD
jgi:hypothetical protein